MLIACSVEPSGLPVFANLLYCVGRNSLMNQTKHCKERCPRREVVRHCQDQCQEEQTPGSEDQVSYGEEFCIAVDAGRLWEPLMRKFDSADDGELVSAPAKKYC